MSSSLWAVYVVFLGALLSRATAQAPGDREAFCDGLNADLSPPEYPANSKILMDSFNYRSLLAVLEPFSSVWQQVDNDNTTTADGVSPVTWFQSTAISCRQTMSVCGFQFGKQDNWLITQHISRVVNDIRLPQVSVLIQFELKGCNVNGCQRTFILNAWETSTVDRTAARKTANYRLVNRVAPDDDSGLSKQDQTRELNFRTDEDGFYLAIQDETSCIALLRVIIFYHVCPGGVSDLVIRPETLAPIIDRQSPLVEVTTTCVTGASPERGGTAKLTCAQGGVWNAVPGSGCRCNSGLVETGDGLSCIEACPASQYLSMANSECRKCPANSMSEVSGLPECPCVTDYYRRSEETDLPCTQPPGLPTNVQVVPDSPTSFLLTWDPPEFTGGRDDITYSLWYEPEGGERRKFSTVTGTTGNITGLDSGVRYRVYVSAENGVSDTDRGIPIEDRLVLGFDEFPPDDMKNLIIGIVMGMIVVILVIAVLIILVVILRTRSSKKALMEYHEVIPIKLKGRKATYIDPLTYASPDEAVEEFATEIEPKMLQVISEIGGGEFGTVFRGIWKEQSKKQVHVAIKTLKAGSSSKMRTDFLNEASIMGQFDHVNVIQLYGVITKVDPAMIVMEFMENGSLYSYLRKNDEKLTTHQLLKMTRGVCSGMEFLSSMGFVHRDLAARNILLSKDEVCKVADFGLSREVIDDEYNVQKGGKIPVRWTAPEAIYRRKFTSSSDVWSFGVLMWEVMSFAQHPYDEWDNQAVLDKLEQGYRLPKPYGCPDAVYNVMLDCWNKELSQRPSFADNLKRLDGFLQTDSSAQRPNKPHRNSSCATNPLQCKSVEAWLASVKMERYTSIFKDNGISNVRELVHITEADLRDMGITLPGHLHLLTKSIESGYMELKQNVAMV